VAKAVSSVQARPETVESRPASGRAAAAGISKPMSRTGSGKGRAIWCLVSQCRPEVIATQRESTIREGDLRVTNRTDRDWKPDTSKRLPG